jgi:predicted 2-oxoglutarate/Fe(II)-dependent dioxygenase YbiX
MKFDYVYYKNLFNIKEVKEINYIIEKNKDLLLKDNPAKNVIKTADVTFIEYKFLKKKLKKLIDYITESNQNHFSFDLYNMCDSKLFNINNYKVNQNVGYDWHKDSSQDHASDIKLTVILNLSEKKYEGGKFHLYGIGELNMFNETGDVLIFKSFLLHKVDKILSGERKTLSIWMNGPSLK